MKQQLSDDLRKQGYGRIADLLDAEPGRIDGGKAAAVLGTLARLPRITPAMAPGPAQIYEDKWPAAFDAGVEIATGVIACNRPPATNEHDWIVDAAPVKKKAK